MTQGFSILHSTSDALTAFGAEPVTVGRLTSAHFAFTWFEGVAIVQAACRALHGSASRTNGVPLTPASVRIDQSGTVSLDGVSVDLGAAGVRQIASLLRSVMPDDVPVSLRLVLSQALSDPPFYESIESLSQGLAYFERPDPAAIIQGVFRRWENGGGTSAPQERQTAAADSVDEKPVEPRRRRAPLSRNDITTALLSAGALSVLIAVGLLAFTARPAQLATDTPGTSEPAGNSAAEGNPAAKPEITPSRSRATTGAAVARTTVSAPVARSETAVGLALTVPLSAGDEDVPELPSYARSPIAALPTPETDTPSAELGRRAPLREAVGSAIYSIRDTDVAPPVAVYPRFPSEESVRAQGAALVFDVVINGSGAVESVKSRRPPTSMGDALLLTMTLSAAKTWRFEPATRNGEYVKYRREIWIPR